MNHRYKFPSPVLMWSCGARIAAYQIAMVIDRQLVADDEEDSPVDSDYGSEEDFGHLGIMF
jgi:hypothetical protein